MCAECGEGFVTEEEHYCHTLECGEAFYMEDDHLQHSLDQHYGEVSEESSTEVSESSTKVSDDISNEPEFKDTPDVVPDGLHCKKHNY